MSKKTHRWRSRHLMKGEARLPGPPKDSAASSPINLYFERSDYFKGCKKIPKSIFTDKSSVKAPSVIKTFRGGEAMAFGTVSRSSLTIRNDVIGKLFKVDDDSKFNISSLMTKSNEKWQLDSVKSMNLLNVDNDKIRESENIKMTNLSQKNEGCDYISLINIDNSKYIEIMEAQFIAADDKMKTSESTKMMIPQVMNEDIDLFSQVDTDNSKSIEIKKTPPIVADDKKSGSIKMMTLSQKNESSENRSQVSTDNSKCGEIKETPLIVADDKKSGSIKMMTLLEKNESSENRFQVSTDNSKDVEIKETPLIVADDKIIKSESIRTTTIPSINEDYVSFSRTETDNFIYGLNDEDHLKLDNDKISDGELCYNVFRNGNDYVDCGRLFSNEYVHAPSVIQLSKLKDKNVKCFIVCLDEECLTDIISILETVKSKIGNSNWTGFQIIAIGNSFSISNDILMKKQFAERFLEDESYDSLDYSEDDIADLQARAKYKDSKFIKHTEALHKLPLSEEEDIEEEEAEEKEKERKGEGEKEEKEKEVKMKMKMKGFHNSLVKIVETLENNFAIAFQLSKELGTELEKFVDIIKNDEIY